MKPDKAADILLKSAPAAYAYVVLGPLVRVVERPDGKSMDRVWGLGFRFKCEGDFGAHGAKGRHTHLELASKVRTRWCSESSKNKPYMRTLSHGKPKRRSGTFAEARTFS